MQNQHPSIQIKDPWDILNRFTTARIALGRAGMSLTTKAHLEFQLAHARARDSVSIPLDFSKLEQDLKQDGLETIHLHTRAPDRPAYLQRPDKGRFLNQASIKNLQHMAGHSLQPDIALIIADGLSSAAIANHARPFLQLLMPEIIRQKYVTAPVILVEQGRVAVCDHVGEILSAKMAIILIGERPGLSSPDSMGIYFTWHPKQGLTDADRNCISNIHQNGLSYAAALQKLMFLITESLRLKLSGVHLKETIPIDGPLEQVENKGLKNRIL